MHHPSSNLKSQSSRSCSCKESSRRRAERMCEAFIRAWSQIMAASQRKGRQVSPCEAFAGLSRLPWFQVHGGAFLISHRKRAIIPAAQRALFPAVFPRFPISLFPRFPGSPTIIAPPAVSYDRLSSAALAARDDDKNTMPLLSDAKAINFRSRSCGSAVHSLVARRL